MSCPDWYDWTPDARREPAWLRGERRVKPPTVEDDSWHRTPVDLEGPSAAHRSSAAAADGRELASMSRWPTRPTRACSNLDGCRHKGRKPARLMKPTDGEQARRSEGSRAVRRGASADARASQSAGTTRGRMRASLSRPDADGFNRLLLRLAVADGVGKTIRGVRADRFLGHAGCRAASHEPGRSRTVARVRPRCGLLG